MRTKKNITHALKKSASAYGGLGAAQTRSRSDRQDRWGESAPGVLLGRVAQRNKHAPDGAECDSMRIQVRSASRPHHRLSSTKYSGGCVSKCSAWCQSGQRVLAVWRNTLVDPEALCSEFQMRGRPRRPPRHGDPRDRSLGLSLSTSAVRAGTRLRARGGPSSGVVKASAIAQTAAAHAAGCP